MNKNCLHCKEPLTGRRDKKFCDDHCRNSYNNELRRDITNNMRNVNNLLKKNYRILSSFHPFNKKQVSVKELYKMGFDFTYFTSRYETKQGKVYQYVYDLGYTHYSKEHILVVQKKDWVNEMS